MPDLVTHATFAKEVIEILGTKELIRNNLICYLGAQGPDVFYFHQLRSIIKNKDYKNFGNKMHDENTASFLIESMKYLKEHYSEELYSYLCGFLCHHALDRNCHPYVYYVTGKGEIKYRGNHLRLERAIDSWFIINKWKEQPHRFNIRKRFLNLNINKNIFLPYYNNILDKVYNKKNGGKAFINSFKNFKFYTGLIYDPHGIIKGLGKFIDKYINRKSRLVLETISYYNNIDESIDYLNLNKKEWKHPVNLVSSNLSFLELYDKAQKEAVEEIQIMDDYLNNQIDLSELKKKINNLSYSTGLLCTEDNEMKYFNVIF